MAAQDRLSLNGMGFGFLQATAMACQMVNSSLGVFWVWKWTIIVRAEVILSKTILIESTVLILY